MGVASQTVGLDCSLWCQDSKDVARTLVSAHPRIATIAV